MDAKSTVQVNSDENNMAFELLSLQPIVSILYKYVAFNRKYNYDILFTNITY